MSGVVDLNIKKIISALLSLTIFFSGFCAYAADDVTVVTTPEEFRAISLKLYGKYSLGCDIDFNGDTLLPLDLNGAFTGVLDGNGFSIKNVTLSYDREGESARLGIFANSRGTVKNLSVTGVKAQVPNKKYTTVGVIVAQNSGTVENTFVDGSIDIPSEKGQISVAFGGITGVTTNGSIKNCKSKVDLRYDGDALANVGGISGTIGAKAVIENSAYFGDIQIVGGNEVYAGGIVGSVETTVDNKATVTDCISIADISVQSKYSTAVGGILGQVSTYNENNTVKSAAEINGCISGSTIKAYSTTTGGFYGSNTTVNIGSVAGMFYGNGKDNEYLLTKYKTKSTVSELKPVSAFSNANGEFSASLYNPEKPLKLINKNDISVLLPKGEASLSAYVGKKIYALNSEKADELSFAKNFETQILGDIDGDGDISVYDAVLIRSAVLKESIPLNTQAAADVNGDGEVTVTDIVAVLDGAVRK